MCIKKYIYIEYVIYDYNIIYIYMYYVYVYILYIYIYIIICAIYIHNRIVHIHGYELKLFVPGSLCGTEVFPVAHCHKVSLGPCQDHRVQEGQYPPHETPLETAWTFWCDDVAELVNLVGWLRVEL